MARPDDTEHGEDLEGARRRVNGSSQVEESGHQNDGDVNREFEAPRATKGKSLELLQLMSCENFLGVKELRGLSTGEALLRIAEHTFPCIKWLKIYKWSKSQADIIAGMTVGVMLIPQGMAYAMIAGLEPQYGLYAGFIPVYVYAIFGSSRQLAVGPVALVSLLTESNLSSLADSETQKKLYAELAVKLAFLCGLIQFLMGLFRFGFIVNFLGHSVVSGFTSGAAILIGLSQLKHIMGYDIKKSHVLHETMQSTFEGIDGFHGLTFGTGCAWIVMLLTMKHIGKTYPKFKWVRACGPLITCFVSGLFTATCDLEKKGVKIIGAIEPGLPEVQNVFNSDHFSDLIVGAVVISLVGFLESISIAKGIAAKRGYEVNATQELNAIGLANIFGSLFSAYPTTGSFSRSAVNNDTGAESGVSAFITATLILVTLLILTPVFYFLPKNVLAAVVMSSVFGLIDTDEFKFLWKINKKDFVLWMASFLGTLFLGVELGVGIAVLISLCFVIYESALPHIAILGQLPNTKVYRSIAQYPEASTHEGIVIMRFDAPIYFANVGYLKDKLREFELLSVQSHQDGKLQGVVHYFILEMTPVSSIDAAGVHALMELVDEFKKRKVQLVIANPNGAVMQLLERAGLNEKIGHEWTFMRCADAVAACQSAMSQLVEPIAIPYSGSEQNIANLRSRQSRPVDDDEPKTSI